MTPEQPRLAHNILLPKGLLVIAGLCMARSKSEIDQVAAMVKENGATVLRAGIDKPRTNSTGEANALGNPITHPIPTGYEWLADAGRNHKIFTATEVMGPKHLEIAISVGIDVLWTGAASGLSPYLLQTVGESGWPSLHKNAHGCTFAQFVGAIDHVRAGRKRNCWSTHQIFFLERGTTPEASNPTRGIPRIDWVSALVNKGELVVGDISHTGGSPEFAIQLARAYLAVGAIGIMVEVTLEEGTGAVDGSRQAVGPKRFEKLMKDIKS